ncbi:synapse differentiation-inducing gene protein 1-like [Paramormyrops kingsleyae]|uniref:Synapse differentiation-inducing gene protein 1-like n=1 Tax=Paramormyrops kingsleyae TaxID=1676925 RepID=A0A3B3TAV8_9TELE|nr:synapse differentiation-inducing gene protein 1-like [Paramormyrops kingsleyae]
MESPDELDQPLLSDKKNETSSGSGLLKVIMVKCEEAKMIPTPSWRRDRAPSELRQQQLLDARSLPCDTEALYPAGPAWGLTGSTGLHRNHCMETAFVDMGPGSTLERKLLEDGRDNHSIGYCTDEEDLVPSFEESSSDDYSDTETESSFSLVIPQDYLGLAVFAMLCCFWPLGIAAFYLSQKTNKASAQGDFQRASLASRQAFWLAVLSIIFGIITYVCAVATLVSYLSGKPP